MSWCKYERGASQHPKVLALAHLLEERCSTPPAWSASVARGIVTALWDHCLAYSPDGVLADVSPRILARAVDWPGRPEELLELLLEVGLVDQGEFGPEVHGWMERAEGYRVAARQRRSRARRAASSSDLEASSSDQEEKQEEGGGGGPQASGAGDDVTRGHVTVTPENVTVTFASPSPSPSLSLIRGGAGEISDPRGGILEVERDLGRLVEWWAEAEHPSWCPPPRPSTTLSERWPLLVAACRRLVADDARAGPSRERWEAVAAYLERAWHDPWVRERKKGGAYLLGAGTDERPGELERRIERALEGYDQSPEARRRRKFEAAQTVMALEEPAAEARHVVTPATRALIEETKRALGVRS